MSKKMSKKRQKMTQEQRMIHAHSQLHLDACIQGGNVYRNRKRYTRKGKERFDYRKFI